MEKFDRHNPALATLKERYALTKEGSTKQTWHITLDLKGVDLPFKPGDSVGICPQNDPTLVHHLIQSLQAKPDTPVFHKRLQTTMPLSEFLLFHANLSRLTSSFLKVLYGCMENCSKKSHLQNLLDPENMGCLKEFLATYDPLQFLRDYGQTQLPLQEICDLFGPLLPRFYSIASSKHVQKDALDLTVALFTWDQSGEKRYGVASHFLCHLAQLHQTPVPLYVQPAHHFALPQDPHASIIMVGPGTGIAPFRAFMQERLHFGSKGKNWLFFGERNRHSDYFYEEYWQELHTKGHLRVHTAFSRDQADKIYVQHKMLEHSKELYAWLEEGAHFYVCGDAAEMARDVELTLHEILCKEGNFTQERAHEHLKALKKEGRYLTDVY